MYIFNTLLFSNEAYSVYEKPVPDDFNQTYVKIKGFNNDIELINGAGTPKVLSLKSLGKEIKLLYCFGGKIGTSVMVEYYYIYVLDFKNQKVVGMLEYYVDDTSDLKLDIKPKWSLKENTIEVIYYDEQENKKKVFEL